MSKVNGLLVSLMVFAAIPQVVREWNEAHAPDRTTASRAGIINRTRSRLDAASRSVLGLAPREFDRESDVATAM